tara:strand:- start:2048 stop:2188 length:141 start_codon:yes stop_codon:yes gene_type:complete
MTLSVEDVELNNLINELSNKLIQLGIKQNQEELTKEIKIILFNKID